MFAVIKTGGKQYRVAAEDEITVMTLAGEPGDVVAFDVLALFDGETSQIGAPLVAGGPYRVLSHPNYLVVIGEIATLPLCFGLPWLSLLFSIANAGILSVRIRAENAALTGSLNVGHR